MKGMPTPLVLAVVIAMLFGVMNVVGGLGSCLGVASISSQPAVVMPPPLDVPFNTLMERAQWVSIGSFALALLLQVPAGVALVTGAALTVYRHRLARRVLGAALLAGATVELVMTALGLVIQFWILGPTRDLLDATTQMAPPGAPLPPWFESIPLVIMVITGVAFVISMAWLAVKVALYGFAWTRLRADAVAAWFSEAF